MPAHEHHRRHGHASHTHGVMSGRVVRPYDLLIGGLLMRGTYAAITDLLARRVPQAGTVVDVGTGPGRLPVLLARGRPDLTVIGIDPSADMLARAGRRADGLSNLRFVEAGAEQIPLPDASADAVVSSLSSHHWADLDAALAEQARLLKPGGELWLFDMLRELPADLAERIARTGLILADLPSPLGWLSRRRLGHLAATRPD